MDIWLNFLQEKEMNNRIFGLISSVPGHEDSFGVNNTSNDIFA
jgi:hypothetical protein